MPDIPEKDWRLLRELKPVAMERFSERILNEAVEIATTPQASSYERYIRLYKMINKRDRDFALAFDDHRRSATLDKIFHIHSCGLMTAEEFARFSENIRKWVLELESP